MSLVLVGISISLPPNISCDSSLLIFEVLSNVLGVIPWVIDFIVDSGWAQEIVR